jgi:glucose-6-phosphate-specific signal transduction histidine kinase
LSHDDLAKSRSFGIRGLHERAGTVGGWVDLASRQGVGTTLILSVPLHPENEPSSIFEDSAHDHDASRWGDA